MTNELEGEKFFVRRTEPDERRALYMTPLFVVLVLVNVADLIFAVVFIGGKIFAADMLGLAKIPPVISLGVTFAILAAGVAWSMWKTGREARGA